MYRFYVQSYKINDYKVHFKKEGQMKNEFVVIEQLKAGGWIKITCFANCEVWGKDHRRLLVDPKTGEIKLRYKAHIEHILVEYSRCNVCGRLLKVGEICRRVKKDDYKVDTCMECATKEDDFGT